MDLFQERIKELLNTVDKEYENNNMKIRIQQAADIYNWWRNDAHEIKEFLKLRFLKTFKKSTIDRFPSWNYRNGIPKILNILCSLYQQPPKRTILKDGKEDETATNIYKTIVNTSNLNSVMQQVQELGWLMNVLPVMVVWRNEKINYDILYPEQIDIETEETDYTKIKQIAILSTELDAKGKEERIVIVWNKDEHYIEDQYGKRAIYKDEVSNEMKNIYGEIPVATLVYKQSPDFWGSPKYNLIESYTALSMQNIYKDYIMFFHYGGIPFAKNLKLSNKVISGSDVNYSFKVAGKQYNTGNSRENNISLSADSIIEANTDLENQDIDFKFVSPQSNLTLVDDLINSELKSILSELNISANMYSLETKSESGYSKMVSEYETQQAKNLQRSVLQQFERDLFKVTKLVYNYWNNKQIFTDVHELSIDYKETFFPRNEVEILSERNRHLLHNTRTPIDFIMEDNPDLTKEEAEQIYLENIDINKQQSNPISLNSFAKAGRDDRKEKNHFGRAGVEDETCFDFPDLRQYSDYDCGAGASLDVLSFYGEDSSIENMISELGTSKESGTNPEDIVKYFESKGFQVDMRQMTIEEVKQYIDKEIPVILDVQAWHNDSPSDYDYTNEWNDGHYIVAHGYNASGLIVDDPSSVGKAMIEYDDLESRWHDIDGTGKQIQKLGIAIFGKEKVFNNDKLIKVG